MDPRRPARRAPAAGGGSERLLVVLGLARPRNAGPKGCLVLWRRRDEEPDYTCRMLLDRLVRITGLVLERAWAAADLLHAATTDALTGLANRATFFRQLSEAVFRPRTGPLVGVLYLDIDDFKPVIDRLGHAAATRCSKRSAGG